MISPIQIFFTFGSLITIVVLALVIASRNEKKSSFFIWGLLILFLPFIGGIGYLIKHFTSRKIKTA
jgi:hypothetical protein